jgi:serine-type D-Ala-D-Ala carboxypeptidase (penicillin-binding protein 5/6)
MHVRTARLTVCAALAALAAGFAAPAQARSADTPSVNGRAAYLLDATTGKEQYSKEATTRMPVASLTKVMTAYVVINSAEPDNVVQVEQQDRQYAENGGGTSAYLRAGDRLTVEQMLYGLMLPSGADAAHALARTYGPGVAGFTDKMNATARYLGMNDTRYVNADGLPTAAGNGFSTAKDQAKLAEIALRDPLLEKVSSAAAHTLPASAGHSSYTWTNTNRLLGTPGVIGLKTGYTRAAGYCLSFAGERQGHRLIGVILGETVSSRRFQSAAALLDWGAPATTP